ncbi:MAG TPA: DNA repair protein RecO [Chitinophagaceae bacterium]|nr:DNA repair protein RecO [Chitinophagaceae bacterium]
MIHQTRGIVLRSVKYGETSIITTIFTELFGIQSYMVKGARASARGRAPRGNLLQVANMLDMMVYYRENASLQYISEFRLDYVYQPLSTNLIRNAVSLYIAELLLKSLKQPQGHPDLYFLTSQTLKFLDRENETAANIPLYFTLNLASLLGFRFNGSCCPQTPYLDLREGSYMAKPPDHPHFLDADLSARIFQLQLASGPEQATAISLDRETRIRLLNACLSFLEWHLPEFTPMKSPRVLHDLLD